MPRRAPRQAGPRTRDAGPPSPAEADLDLDADAERAAWLGERLRRVALGLTLALVVSRAFWPGEPDYRVDAGTGLPWTLALLVVAGLGLAAPLIGGRFRWRWSWADVGVVAMVGFIAAASSTAVDRRPAINLAWEWGGIAVAYVLLRNLPRTRGESVAVIGALAASAFAVSVYGLYHVGVELPQVRQAYLNNREEALRLLGIAPGTPAQAQYENRLLGSNEVTATFGLANSLAGFLVGPLVVALGLAWDNLTRRGGGRVRWGDLALAVPLIGVVAYALILTKSRSAVVGLAVGLVVLAWRERNRLGLRALAAAALGLALVGGTLGVLAYRAGGLDTLVLTQTGKSLQYRLDYWRGAWGVINESSATFWRGHGPGNFADPYVLHKVPGASEEIKDPHNLALEVWASGGLRAVLGLALALGFGLWGVFAPDRADARPPDPAESSPPPSAVGRGAARRVVRDPDAPPASAAWLVAAAGLALFLALPPIGGLKLFEGDFDRWLILVGAWLIGLASGRLLFANQAMSPALLGAGFLAIVVNLLAAGGVSVPAVALTLWGLLAVGLNLRDDRRCGVLRESGGRTAAFAVACVWVALLGTFVGAIRPHWRAQALIDAAADAIDVRGRAPDFDAIEEILTRAAEADPLSARPWSLMASIEYEAWMSRGGKADDLRWQKIPIELYKAVSPPRNPNAWSRHRERAMMTALLLKRLGGNLTPKDVTRYRADVIEASRRAARLYPSSPALRAWLSEASADIGMIPDAVKEGREALRLDDLMTPHPDKRLDPQVRQWLQARLPEWEKQASQNPAFAPPAP